MKRIDNEGIIDLQEQRQYTYLTCFGATNFLMEKTSEPLL